MPDPIHGIDIAATTDHLATDHKLAAVVQSCQGQGIKAPNVRKGAPCTRDVQVGMAPIKPTGLNN